jgi:hypothetical protein
MRHSAQQMPQLLLKGQLLLPRKLQWTVQYQHDHELACTFTEPCWLALAQDRQHTQTKCSQHFAVAVVQVQCNITQLPHLALMQHTPQAVLARV